jgi:WD40 repeat protein
MAAVGILVAVVGWYVITRPRWQQLDGQDHVVGFSADGRVLATMDRDGLGNLWDPEAGQPRDDLAGKVTGLPFPFSADGRYHAALLPADVNKLHHGSAAVVETKTKRQIFKFDYDTWSTLQNRHLGFAANGKFFFSKGPMADHSSCVWSLPDGKKVFTDSKPLFAISNHGEKVARYYEEVTAGKRSSILDIVGVENGETELSLERWGRPKGIVFSSDESQLVEVFDGGASSFDLVLHDLENNETANVEGRPYYHMYSPFVLQFIHDDRLIEVTGYSSEHPMVAVCTASTQDFRLVWNARCISSNKKWCFREQFGNKRQTVLQVFEISPQIAEVSKGNSPPATYEFTYDSLLYPRQAAISDDGRIVVIVGQRSDVRDETEMTVVDVVNQNVLLKRTFHSSHLSRINDIYLSPNGRHVAATVRTSEGSEVHWITIR